MIDSSRYTDWKAPDEDGQILIWPEPAELLVQARQNHVALGSTDALLQNLPLKELRRRQRAAIGCEDDEQLVFATGHQTELHHPGVWAKDVMIHRAAARTGGQAIHIAVDTDSPKHLQLRWPGGAAPITDDPRISSAPWAQLIASPSSQHIYAIRQAVDLARRDWEFEPLADRFLESLARSSANHASLPAALVGATQDVHGRLGVAPRCVLASTLWPSDAFLIFAHHFLARAGEFAGQYNAALRDYRIEQGIASPGRPMPDLEVHSDRAETPFWLDDRTRSSRARLVLTRSSAGWRLEDFPFDPALDADRAAGRLAQFLGSRNWRISPRAMMLTMYLRLLLADQFVHGIGGALYDQVTDRMIHTHLALDPPRFAVTTATLYFPAAKAQDRVSLGALLEEGRRLRHGWSLTQKRELAGQIALLPRRSPKRRELFVRMHKLLTDEGHSPRMQEWAIRLHEAGERQVRQKAWFDRELFFAIQPEARLRGIVARYDAAL